MAKQVLEKEPAYFESNKAEFLSKFPGRYLLIYGDSLEGDFENEDEAYDKGYEKFGAESFLVRQVTDVEKTIHLVCDVALQ